MLRSAERRARAAAICLFLFSAAGGAGTTEAVLSREDGDLSAKASFLQEIIVTNDALDSPRAVSDTILHLRGAIDVARQTDLGRFGASLAGSAHAFRTVSIENDRSASVGISHETVIGDRAALRTALRYGIEDQGDSLDLGAIVIGTRTRSETVTASVETTVKLAETIALRATLSNAYEDVGRSRFTIALPDLRLTPSSNRLNAGLALAHQGEHSPRALIVHAERVTLHGAVPFASAFAINRVGAAARFTFRGPLGLELTAEGGVDHLSDANGFSNRFYPVYQLRVERSPAGGTGASLSLRGYLDTVDGDDPLASHVHRAEFELSRPLPFRLTASAGLFGELRDNLALGNAEEAGGLYVALAHDPLSNLSLLLRIDYAQRHRTVVDLDQTTLSAKFGLRLRL